MQFSFKLQKILTPATKKKITTNPTIFAVKSPNLDKAAFIYNTNYAETY